MCAAAQFRGQPRRMLRFETRQYLSAFAGSQMDAGRQGGSSATYLKRATMKNTLRKKQLGLAVTCALALGIVSGAAQAQMGSTTPDDSRQLWTEATKTQIWRNPQGLCWQSPYGPPPGYSECNPAPVAQYVPPPPAPVYVAPAPVYVAPPAPAPVIAPAPLEPRKPRG